MNCSWKFIYRVMDVFENLFLSLKFQQLQQSKGYGTIYKNKNKSQKILTTLS